MTVDSITQEITMAHESSRLDDTFLFKRLPRFESQHLKHLHSRAESGKGGLEQVCADKGCEQQAIGAVELRQKQTDQDKTARHSQYQAINIHHYLRILIFSKSYAFIQ